MELAALYAIYQQYPNICIDTRQIVPNSIFVAIGQKDANGIHRGNQFAKQAIQQGAAYCIINDANLKAEMLGSEQFILVDDCEQTLQTLAQYHRRQLNIPIIAIAGSNGKTTTKELIYNVLATEYHTFATRGNLNNHLGVPLSLLQLTRSHQIAILEIGANHLNETAFLCELVEPNFGLVTNCGKDHLGEYGSFENVVRSNAELYDYLAQAGGTAFVCTDDALLWEISAHVGKRSAYGSGTATAATIEKTPFLGIQLSINQVTKAVQTQLFGRFWRDTVVAAAHIGAYFNVPVQQITQAIANYTPASLRSQQLTWQNNRVLLDCYNANPSSMEVFVAEIQACTQANKILILGEMLELGAYSQTEHAQLIASLDWAQLEAVVLVGHEFEHIALPTVPQLHHFPSYQEAKTWIWAQQWQHKNIYVKGSRGNRLEKIVEPN